MLIASTAHYGKFADSVLNAIDRGSMNANPGDLPSLFQSLEILDLKPSMHVKLKETTQHARKHTGVLDANIDCIRNVVTEVVSRWH